MENILHSKGRKITALFIFIFITAVSLYIVKWNPYYHKSFIAAANHSIGSSIITGESQVAEAPSFHAAWTYFVAYFNAIWKALLAAIIVSSFLQAIVPKDWLFKALGQSKYGSTFLGGVLGIPSMMCTCCVSPIVVGMKKSNVSTGAAVAYWLSNTALNPAVIIFMAFILSWKFVVLRIVLGVLLVFVVSHFAQKIDQKGLVNQPNLEDITCQIPDNEGGFLGRWGKSLFSLFFGLVPVYFLSVFILGAVRAWLFPAIDPSMANGIVAIILLAIAGALFVIPTAGEIPVVQTLQSFGLGSGPLATLMFTLPVISLPSMLMVSRGLSKKVIVFLFVMVVIFGIVAGLIGMMF